MQLLGLPCASVKSPKNVRLPLPLILQLLIAMTLLLSQMMSMILQLMMSKFPHINPPPPPVLVADWRQAPRGPSPRASFYHSSRS